MKSGLKSETIELFHQIEVERFENEGGFIPEVVLMKERALEEKRLNREKKKKQKKRQRKK